MSHGVTNQMRDLSRQLRWRRIEPREQRERDRTLAGKDRVRARKAARRG